MSVVRNREGNGTPLQYSCLEGPMNGGAWWVAVHVVARSQTQLSDFTFIFHFHALEKEMATHSSVLVWRVPEMGEPDGLPSVGSHRVRYNWSDLAAAAAVVHVISLISLLWLWFSFCLPSDDKDKKLMEASGWERLTVGETGSCSNGRGHAQ